MSGFSYNTRTRKRVVGWGLCPAEITNVLANFIQYFFPHWALAVLCRELNDPHPEAEIMYATLLNTIQVSMQEDTYLNVKKESF